MMPLRLCGRQARTGGAGRVVLDQAAHGVGIVAHAIGIDQRRLARLGLAQVLVPAFTATILAVLQ